MIKTNYLIIGGGFAGANAAQKLANAGFRSVLVDRKDYFEVTYATLRNATMPLALPQSPSIRYRDFLTCEFIHSGVTTLGHNEAKLDNGEVVSFDFAIIASGTRYQSLSMAKSNLSIDLNSRHQEVANLNLEIQQAHNVLVLGGGVVGVELAGEIAAAFPGKQITLAHNSSQLLDTFKPRAQKLARQQLEALGVQVQFNRHYSKENNIYRDANTKNTIKADLVYSAIGTQPNSEYLTTNYSSSLDTKGFVQVDSFFKVAGHDNLFAIGDIANSGSPKLGYLAVLQAEHLVKNIIAESQGKKPKPYKPMNNLMALVPTGSKSGLAQLPIGVASSRWLMNIKQKDMFISKTFKGLGIPTAVEKKPLPQSSCS